MASRGDGIRSRLLTRTRADSTQYSIELFVGEVVMGTDTLTGKPVRRTFSAETRPAAEKAKRTLLNERDRQRRPTAAHFTVETYMRHWLDTVIAVDFDPATFASYDQTFRTHINGTYLGGRPLKGRAKLEPTDVDTWKAALAKTSNVRTGRPLAPSTRRRCLTVLRKALGHAFRQGYIDANVAGKDFVDGVKVPKRAIRAMSRAEMQQVLLQARQDRDPDYAMYVLGFATGMRQGELLGLRWAHQELDAGLNLDRGTLRIMVQQQRGQLDQRLKRDSWGVFPLDPSLVAVMRKHYVGLLEQQLQAGSRWKEHGLVFPSRVGTPQRPANAWLGWKRLLRRAGLPDDLRFHDQRSTMASLALADGASLFDVSRMLRHADIRTTANSYAQFMPEGRAAMAERMGRLVLGDGEADAHNA